MKLKELNPETVIAGRSTQPRIIISYNVGRISFNQGASELIGLEKGSLVQFVRDEDDSQNIYVEKVKTNGYEIKKDAKGQLFIANTSICRELVKENSRFLLAGKPTKEGKRTFWGLIPRPKD